MSLSTALNSVSVLFSLIIVGFICGKTNLLSKEGSKNINTLVLYVLLPATIIKSISSSIEKDAFKNILIMVTITFISYIFIILITYLISKKFNIPENKKAVLFIGMGLSNISFMGFPVLSSLFGDYIIFYAVISQGIIFEIFSWGIAFHFLSAHNADIEKKFSLKDTLLKPGILSSFIGLFLLLLQIKLPSFINQTMSILSQATSPMAMLTVGLMLSKSKIKEALQNKYLYISSFVKLFLIPLSILGILYLLGIRGVCMAVPVIELGMPTAAYLAMLSSIAKNDGTLASEQIFVSSLFSIISIPVLVGILKYAM